MIFQPIPQPPKEDLLTWTAKAYPGGNDSGRQQLRCVAALPIADSVNSTEVTKEGHVKHTSTLRHWEYESGKTVLLEHQITWELTEAYALQFAERVESGESK